MSDNTGKEQGLFGKAPDSRFSVWALGANLCDLVSDNITAQVVQLFRNMYWHRCTKDY